MGEVDLKSFLQACSEKFADEDLDDMPVKLCSSWQEQVNDPHWYPFKRVKYEEGKEKEQERVKHIYIYMTTTKVYEMNTLSYPMKCIFYPLLTYVLDAGNSK